MEMITCFPLLLLICSLCTAQLQTETDTKNIPLGKQTEPERRDPTNAADQQQRCAPDIHAVLREMSASLAEQRLMIKLLQTENEAQEAKLRELELEKTELQRQLQAQTVKLRELDLLPTEMDKLQIQLQVKQVAFSASLLASGTESIGPFNTFIPLVFRFVITNIGNAYNSNTGFFTAPVRGAYHFEFYVAGYGHNSQPSAAVLVKNGDNVCTAYDHRESNFGSSAHGIMLLLQAGDTVSLRLWPNARMYDDPNHYSTFSGYLLFTM